MFCPQVQPVDSCAYGSMDNRKRQFAGTGVVPTFYKDRITRVRINFHSEPSRWRIAMPLSFNVFCDDFSVVVDDGLVFLLIQCHKFLSLGHPRQLRSIAAEIRPIRINNT